MVRTTGSLQLRNARMQVQVHEDGEVRYLEARSLIDPGQCFLLPLPVPPRIDGLAMATRLSRAFDLPWALAWGSGLPPEGCTVEFSSDSLRFRRTASSPAQAVGDTCWVADAEGVFTTAATVVAGVETARVPLSARY